MYCTRALSIKGIKKKPKKTLKKRKTELNVRHILTTGTISPHSTQLLQTPGLSAGDKAHGEGSRLSQNAMRC